jgi:hypothetical protein
MKIAFFVLARHARAGRLQVTRCSIFANHVSAGARLVGAGDEVRLVNGGTCCSDCPNDDRDRGEKDQAEPERPVLGPDQYSASHKQLLAHKHNNRQAVAVSTAKLRQAPNMFGQVNSIHTASVAQLKNRTLVQATVPIIDVSELPDRLTIGLLHSIPDPKLIAARRRLTSS